jgi:hypothetical protein
MFSPTAQEFSKLIDMSFIAGVPPPQIKSYINSPNNAKLMPECLLSFPTTVKSQVNSAVLEVI